MWHKLSAYLAQRALIPKWYDYVWLIPVAIVQRVLNLIEKFTRN